MKQVNKIESPALVQTWQWINNPLKFLDVAHEKYGDIFTTKLGWNFRPLVFVNEPQAIKQIIKSESKKFDAPGSVKQIFQPLLGDFSIVRTDNGSRHKRKRKLMMPPFHGDRMAAYSKLICAITEQIVDRLSVGTTFVAQDVMQKIALQVTLEGIFGLQPGERQDSFKQMMASWLDALSSPMSSTLLFAPMLQRDLGSWTPWGHICRLKEQINQLLLAEIAQRRQNPDPSATDILALLMSARDENGEPMSDLELRDELLTLMVAGYETTATAMAWTMYWVYSRPDVQEKIRQELAGLGESPDPMAIARAPYLDAVCKEILRIYPSAYATFPRVVKSPVELMGHKLEPGTELIGCIYLLHQREDLYPEPKKFKPERFLERKFSPQEYMPFGFGDRICIGAAFAIFEMKLVLATLLSKYQLTLVDQKPIKAQILRLTLAPGGGVEMKFQGKQSQQPQKPLAATAT